MKLFDEWKATYSAYKGYSDITDAGVFKRAEKQMEDAFRAGMLAAADIAERMYFYHTPDDGVISGDGIAEEIRKQEGG